MEGVHCGSTPLFHRRIRLSLVSFVVTLCNVVGMSSVKDMVSNLEYESKKKVA